ncbi:hypothetical protein [Pelosinus sp. sgz500959]|uniref:hypothetical protein n=1 Tax=Pelosinus sp. sgz500959 TaxID=3242472 RepID=UPI00366BE2C3
MPNESPNSSLLQTITHMIDTMINEGTGYDTLINVLSLLCLLHILNRTQSTAIMPTAQNIPQTNSSNPLQKILGDLTKGGDQSGGGPSPDLLMSLLPLLNNPQIKSKLNPTNISTILGLMNNLGGSGSSNNDKPEKKEPPAATVSHPVPPHTTNPDEQEKKDLGRSLNWKTNFQNEKEV